MRLSAKEAAVRAAHMKTDFDNKVYPTYTALAAAYGVSINYARNCVVGAKCRRAQPPKGKKKPITIVGLDYFVYEDGRVWSVSTNKLRPTKTGSLNFNNVLTGQRLKTSVARLVLTLFRRPPQPGEIARHLDDDRTNNALSNLEWGFDIDNARDKADNGNQPRGEVITTARMTPAQVIEFVNGYDGSMRKLEYCEYHADEFGMNPKHLMRVLVKKSWAHLWSDKKHIDAETVRFIRRNYAKKKFGLAEFSERMARHLIGKGYQVNVPTIRKIATGKTWTSA